MAEKRADVAIVGAGILGLAHAWHAARAGKRVVIFERHPQAQGASVRNYGLIWPIGQAAGFLHQTAMRSRELWTDILNTYKLPSLATGSMHVCYRDDEADVAKEFCTLAPKQGYTCEWLEPKRAIEKCDALRPHGLKGALFSPTEITIDARTVMRELPRLLGERYRVETRFGYPVRRIELPVVETSEETWKVESAIVCTGDDFETLFPADYKASGLTRCKMQMLRTVPQPKGWKLGPALAGGITMRSSGAFGMCTSLDTLKKRIASENPKYERWGVHVIVSQNGGGELNIGDSHEYGQTPDFFDKADIEDLILDTLDSFTMFPDRTIAQRWNGVFAGHPEKPIVVATPAKGVLIVTGAGGAGLTLGLGLAERICKKFFE